MRRKATVCLAPLLFLEIFDLTRLGGDNMDLVRWGMHDTLCGV